MWKFLLPTCHVWDRCCLGLTLQVQRFCLAPWLKYSPECTGWRKESGSYLPFGDRLGSLATKFGCREPWQHFLCWSVLCISPTLCTLGEGNSADLWNLQWKSLLNLEIAQLLWLVILRKMRRNVHLTLWHLQWIILSNLECTASWAVYSQENEKKREIFDLLAIAISMDSVFDPNWSLDVKNNCSIECSAGETIE